MIKALAHVCLLSRDLDRTLDFYMETLGLSKGFDFFRDGALFGFYLRVADGQFIEVFKTDDLSPEPTARRITHLCLEVDDIDVMRARLVAKGIEVTEKKLGADASWQIWTKDPDGTPIEFHQYTDESCQLTGRVCVVDW
jgi:lactoylglutathione lyase/glyoxylase I family protein